MSSWPIPYFQKLNCKQMYECWNVPGTKANNWMLDCTHIHGIDILVWVVLEYAFEKSRFPGVRWWEGVWLRWVLTWPLLGGWPTSQPASRPPRWQMRETAQPPLQSSSFWCNTPANVHDDAPNTAVQHTVPFLLTIHNMWLYQCVLWNVIYRATPCWIATGGFLLNAGADVTGRQMCTMQMPCCTATYTSLDSAQCT